MKVATGLDRLMDELPDLLRGAKLGLITNQAATDSELRGTVDRLAGEAGTLGAKLVRLFGPEHGLRGDAQAGAEVADAVDDKTGLPVVSLYGETKRPTPDMLDDLDALVFDLPDAGVRFWTNLYTMLYAMEEASRAGVRFVVLDRPNPNGGLRREGNVLDPAFASFVGDYPLSMRTGLTMGEVATLFRAQRRLDVELDVVPMRGWQRSMLFAETGLPFVPPSPNTPTATTLLLYGGTCLVEGTTVSEGRGTTHPFEWIGAPWVDGDRLAERLNSEGLSGVAFRPVHFTPTFSKHEGALCHGVQVHVTAPKEVECVTVGLHMLRALRREAEEKGEPFWREPAGGDGPPAGGAPSRHFVDLLAGGDRLRRAIDDKVPPAALLDEWAAEREAWEPAYREVMLYD